MSAGLKPSDSMLFRICAAESASPVLIRMWPFGRRDQEARQVGCSDVVDGSDDAMSGERFRSTRFDRLWLTPYRRSLREREEPAILLIESARL